MLYLLKINCIVLFVWLYEISVLSLTHLGHLFKHSSSVLIHKGIVQPFVTYASNL